MNRTTPLSSTRRRFVLAALFAVVAFAYAVFATTPHDAAAAQGDIVRGTVSSNLALYASPEDLEPVEYLPIGTTFQALDLGTGWYGAKFNGEDRYFSNVSAFAPYTATDSAVLRGAVVAGPLSVLAAPSSDAPACDVFANGATLQFCQFNDAYYMARLASGVICYIPVAAVRIFAPVEEGSLVRWAGAAGTRVFEAPSEASALLLTFEPGTRLWFADFDAAWLMASMTVNGSVRTVFVPKSDVSLSAPSITDPEPEPAPEPEPEPDPEPEPEPNPEPETPVAPPGPAAPAQTEWVISTVVTQGRASASWDAPALATFRKGAVFTALSTGNGWYQVAYDGQSMYLPADQLHVIPSSSIASYPQYYGVTLSQALAYQNTGSWIVSRGGSWQKASANDIMLYMDPANFAAGTSGYFQFLVLTQPLGVSVATLDAQLQGKGTLAGQGLAFHNAAYDFGVNEAYLISHALHETGNGMSKLAQGLWYDPETQTASTERTDGSTLVYNMYGIGAVDSNPINGGAKYAYEHDWFTPYDAVYGGAYFIARTYLYSDAHTGYGYQSTLSGQNTLYKMLYHPEWVALYHEKPWHQYATDVAWANAQTHYYTQLLADYDYYTLTFEVPTYASE